MTDFKLAISIGEPAGIGADQVIIGCQARFSDLDATLIAICDPNLLNQRALTLGLDIEVLNISDSDLPRLTKAPNKTIYVLDNYTKKSNLKDFKYTAGQINTVTAESTVHYLNHATNLCLTNKIDGLVTCPIQKSVINTIDPQFTGHTEYLEQICNQHFNADYQSVMMLMCPNLKTALVTTHMPLSQVPSSININKITQIAEILDKDLKSKFNLQMPHIMVTGLNPHAGEDGKLGHEEIDIIIPAIKKLHALNIHASGPYAADSIFSSQALSESDIILAMYHDQGLTGFKAKSFNTAANITLGLPIIRTSVDHGTALTLAGTGKINIDSFIYAIKMALQLADNQNN